MILGDLPTTLEPLIQSIDDWNDARKLSVLLEVRIGSGRLMICTMDLRTDLDNRPVARQMRYSLLRYMAGDQFTPNTRITLDWLE